MKYHICLVVAAIVCASAQIGNAEPSKTSKAPAGLSLIPAGEFVMGDSLDASKVNPTHTVTLSAFYMGQKEVTKAEWDEVRNWGLKNGFTDIAAGQGRSDKHPVEMVCWWDVVKWCNARSEKERLTPCYMVAGAVMKTGTSEPTVNWTSNGYRLPTEAEWEKAARGGLSGKRFPWGDTITHSQANYCSGTSCAYDISPTRGNHPTYDPGEKICGTSPVGSFEPNAYGLYDMVGNVWEWCWDWSEKKTTETQKDPRGPSAGTRRVQRSGSWCYVARSARVAGFSSQEPEKGSNMCSGFRVARSTAP